MHLCAVEEGWSQVVCGTDKRLVVTCLTVLPELVGVRVMR